MKESLLNKIESIFGKDRIIYEDIPEKFYYDESTIFNAKPDAVFSPLNEEEVLEFVRFAYKENLKIVPRGGGTGVCGGAVAVYGGVIVNLDKMASIIDFDEVNLCVKVEAGIINYSLKKFLEERGFYYPPDPQSYETSTIGGNIATNAGGPRAIKYGTTKDYVMGLDVVTGVGEMLNTGSYVYKFSSGYNLNELICGSEGTLGIVTKCILRVVPLPTERTVFFMPFYDIKSASRFMAQVQRHNLSFSAIEFIDDTAQFYIEQFLDRKLPHSEVAKCFIFAELEQMCDKKTLETIENIAINNNCLDIYVAFDKNQEERLWEARKKISYAFKHYAKKVYKADVVVPRGYVGDFVDKIKSIGNKKFPIACFGHIGDGNIHVNILDLDGKKEKESVSMMRMVMDIVRQLGGYPSGEHGIGIAKKGFLKNFFSEYHISIWKDIKKIFDPKNIMNTGKIF